MKSLKIAASHSIAGSLLTHREVVTLADTDFTDVAVVVISVADSQSGILTLLKRTGFNLPVFIVSETVTDDLPAVTGIITGQSEDYLTLENAACEYEEQLLPPFFSTLTQYVAMENTSFACPGHQHGEFFKNILPDGSFMISSARMSFARICAMPMYCSVIC